MANNLYYLTVSLFLIVYYTLLICGVICVLTNYTNSCQESAELLPFRGGHDSSLAIKLFEL